MGTVIVGLGLIAIVSAISVKMIKNKKSGQCNCSSCPSSSICHKNIAKNK